MQHCSFLSIFSILMFGTSTIAGFSAGIQHASLRQAIRMTSSAFTSSSGTTVVFLVPGDGDGINDSDFPPPEEATEYTGSVDWDAEWKKVVANEGKLAAGKERPGKNFYKSEADIAAIKAANSATEQIAKAGSFVSNAMPDVRSLSGDWRFWIAVLALVSIGISVLSAPQDIATSGLQGDSYYI